MHSPQQQHQRQQQLVVRIDLTAIAFGKKRTFIIGEVEELSCGNPALSATH